MNQISLSGRVGKEVELRYISGSGKAVASFSLAVKRPFTSDKTDWFDVVVWDKQAEFVANNIAKGEQILVYGYITIEVWEKEGVKHSRPKVTGSVEKFQWNNDKTSKTQTLDDNLSDDFRAIDDGEDLPW
jgi:single-strand DNA-binding protein